MQTICFAQSIIPRRTVMYLAAWSLALLAAHLVPAQTPKTTTAPSAGYLTATSPTALRFSQVSSGATVQNSHEVPRPATGLSPRVARPIKSPLPTVQGDAAVGPHRGDQIITAKMLVKFFQQTPSVTAATGPVRFTPPLTNDPVK